VVLFVIFSKIVGGLLPTGGQFRSNDLGKRSWKLSFGGVGGWAPRVVMILVGVTGGFAIADFDDAAAVGYQETASEGQLVAGVEGLMTLTECWDTVVREALPWAASQSLLEEVAKSWTSAT
jgi:uncharacterized protein DUF5753